MHPAAAVELTLCTAGRAATHLVRWVGYHVGAGARPSGRAATLTVYTSSASSRFSSDRPRQDALRAMRPERVDPREPDTPA
jgi:hypothetical protein